MGGNSIPQHHCPITTVHLQRWHRSYLGYFAFIFCTVGGGGDLSSAKNVSIQLLTHQAAKEQHKHSFEAIFSGHLTNGPLCLLGVLVSINS